MCKSSPLCVFFWLCFCIHHSFRVACRLFTTRHPHPAETKQTTHAKLASLPSHIDETVSQQRTRPSSIDRTDSANGHFTHQSMPNGFRSRSRRNLGVLCVCACCFPSHTRDARRTKFEVREYFSGNSAYKPPVLSSLPDLRSLCRTHTKNSKVRANAY